MKMEERWHRTFTNRTFAISRCQHHGVNTGPRATFCLCNKFTLNKGLTFVYPRVVLRELLGRLASRLPVELGRLIDRRLQGEYSSVAHSIVVDNSPRRG